MRARLNRSAADKITCGRWKLRFEHALYDTLNLKANIAWLMQQVLEEDALDSWLNSIRLRMELDELEQHFQILLHIWSLKHRIASIKFAHHIAKFWQSLGENKKARTRAKAKTRARAEARGERQYRWRDHHLHHSNHSLAQAARSSSTARDRIDGETITYTAAIIAWRERLSRVAQRITGSGGLVIGAAEGAADASECHRFRGLLRSHEHHRFPGLPRHRPHLCQRPRPLPHPRPRPWPPLLATCPGSWGRRTPTTRQSWRAC